MITKDELKRIALIKTREAEAWAKYESQLDRPNYQSKLAWEIADKAWNDFFAYEEA